MTGMGWGSMNSSNFVIKVIDTQSFMTPKLFYNTFPEEENPEELNNIFYMHCGQELIREDTHEKKLSH